MKLNWHSPLPPAHSGIADFTAAVVPALSERFSVRLWTDRKSASERALGAPVRHAARLGSAADDVDAVDVYNMGNNLRYHREIFERARANPGIVLMHDADLTSFFRDYREERHLSGHLEGTGALFDSDVVAGVDARLAGMAVPADQLRRALTGAVLRNALCGVAFTSASYDHLSADAPCPAYRIDLPFLSSASTYDVPPGVVPGRLILFGFLGDNRRVPEILRAIAAFPRRDEMTLHIYGTYHDPVGLEALIRTFRLERQVTVHGHVAEQVLDDAIRSAALVLNLRYPSMGEASASQLRAWALGKASVVTPIGWYAALPQDSVLSAPLDREQGALHASFTLALDDPAHLRAIGANGKRRFVDRHSPARFAQALEELLVDLPALRARWTVRYWTARTLEASAGWRVTVPPLCWARVTEAMAGLTPAGFIDPNSPGSTRDTIPG